MMKKAALNKDYLFEFNHTQPLSSSPVLAFTGVSGAVSVTLTARADITLNAIADDRRTLTATVSQSALDRGQESAFLLTGADSWYAVTLTRISDTQVIIDSPLPRGVVISGSTTATLQFATWRYTLTSAQLSSVADYYNYTVSYSDYLSSSSSTDRQSAGVIKVTRQPFKTGLTHSILVGQFSALSDMVPRRQQDWKPQIDAAHDEITLHVRQAVLPVDVTEDEVFNPEIFRLAHAYCTHAIILEMMSKFDDAERMRVRCMALMDLALKSISLDIDGDGVIDSGEESVNQGARAYLRGNFKNRTVSAYEAQWKPARGLKF